MLVSLPLRISFRSSRDATFRPYYCQSVSLGVAITLSHSAADRRVSSAWSRFASSSIPIHRSLRMRLTRSFVAASGCFKRSSAVSTDVLRLCFFSDRAMDRTNHAFRFGCWIIARRSNSPAHYADFTPSFYFLERQRKVSCVRRSIFRRGWLPASLMVRKISYVTTMLNKSFGHRVRYSADCRVSAINASTSRKTGTRKRNAGASAAMMM